MLIYLPIYRTLSVLGTVMMGVKGIMGIMSGKVVIDLKTLFDSRFRLVTSYYLGNNTTL